MIAAETPGLIDLSGEPDFEIGPLAVRPSIREAGTGAARETLEPRVMQALVALARRKGEVVSRDRLIELCWGGRIVGDDAINGCVSKVRRLGEAHQAFKIETIPRVGYRLTEQGAAAAQARKNARPWKAIAAAAILVLALLAGLGTWLLSRPTEVRVAVTAFQPLSTDPGAQALAVRVRDQIASVLSVRQVDVASIGSAKTAQLVVSGTVEQDGPVARVRVRIDDPRSQTVLWQGVFEGESGPNSPAPERAAAKVTDLIVAATSVLRSSKGQIRPEALKGFVLGLDSWRDGQVNEPLEFYRTFLKGAPNLSVAHSSYAAAALSASSRQTPETARALHAEAEREAKRALQLDPGDATAYRVLSQAVPAFDLAARDRWVSEGLKRAPNDGSLNVQQGLLLASEGRNTEGLPFIRRGLALDPLSPAKNFGAANSLAGADLPDEARVLLDRARRIWPRSATELNSSLSFAINFMPPDEGLDLIAAMERGHPEFAADAELWRQYFTALKCDCGQAAAGQRIEAAADRLSPRVTSTALSRLGQLDQAFRVVERQKPRFQHADTWLLFVPASAPMRHEARFMDLAAKLGLAQYWRASGRWPDYCAEPGLPYDCKIEAARAVALLTTP